MFSSQNSQVSNDAVFVEDIFSTTLYTGNGSTQTITNGIDLSTYGGLTWSKRRDSATGGNHVLIDTVRGAGNYIGSNTTSAQATDAQTITAFGTTGYSIGTSTRNNTSAGTYASWTFRKQPKFFDVQTFTYPLTGSITVNHSLGSTPGCVIVKATDGADNWYIYHRMANNGTNPSNYILQLNSTAAQVNNFASWITVGSTSITFPSGALNPGSNFVMYLFAHDAGGFGLTGTDNVISCGSYTGNGSTSGPVTTLGYEPQWILIKNASATTGGWVIVDNMRGLPVGAASNVLRANVSGAESTSVGGLTVTATGFQQHDTDPNFNEAGSTYIYIAIRRGPMKVPTSGTSVFSPVLTTTNNTITTNFPVDLTIFKADKGTTSSNLVFDRLRGQAQRLVTSTTGAEATATAYPLFDNNTGTALTGFTAGLSGVDWAFKRAPSFFDEVCYTGTGSATTVTHNLGVAPELIITKKRSSTESWWTWCNYAPNSTNGNYANALNATWAYDNQGTSIWGSTVTRTSAAYSVGSVQEVNGSGITYVAYLFATCAGVSKVGSYTGTATTKQVDCGFTAGARFVLIKRTDSTGDWYVWDSARGIVSGNDPYLLMNSSAAEVTSTDYIDTYSAGFEISSTAPAAINASGGTFIFLAIA